MDVSNYQFSDEEIERLQQYRDNQNNVRLNARFIALLMLAKGNEIKDAASVIGKSIGTVDGPVKSRDQMSRIGQQIMSSRS